MMKITNLVLKPITLPLNQPFKIALGTELEYVGVILQIETNQGIVGIGEASPSSTITGETPGTVIHVIENKIKPLLLHKNPLNIEKIMDEINSSILHNSSAKCAVDIALHDILGKYLNLSLKEIFGGFKDEILTSFAIGIKSIKETINEAHSFVNQGAKVIKIKIGLSPQEDIEKIKTLRKEMGNKVKIRVDANQGYSLQEAIYVLNKIESYDIEFVEQPLPYWNIYDLKQLRAKVGIPIMVDESLHSIHDAAFLIKENACDLFNIKLMKSGGLREAFKIASIAEGAGISCMLGSMVETKIGISAATHLALGMKNIKYADLDGHLFLKKDVVKEGVITKNGVNKVPSTPGIGIELYEDEKIFH